MMHAIPALKQLPIKPIILIFLSVLSMAACLTVAAAQINVAVDRNPVSLDESFQIIFSAGEEPDDEPDFSSLEQDFAILHQSQASSSSWINGKSSKTLQWKLNVMAKHAGNLTIPSIKFGNDASASTTITVTQGATNQEMDTSKDLFLEVEAAPDKTYIQAQVIYTLRLYTRVDIAQARLEEPELADAVIEKLGDDSNYNTQVKGVAYSVTERKYAVFPQKSGRLTIKPLVLTAELLTNNRALFNGFFNSQTARTQRIESKAVTLDVKPAPETFTGQHWLPAEQLELTQTWSGDIKQMKVGEPLTRTLTLTAKGTTVGQLPELNNAKADEPFKVYPDQPVLKEQKQANGLSAFREEKIALIPSKAGSYTLPAIEIPWFNTQSQQMAIARIPETLITAVATQDQQAPLPATPSPVAAAAEPDQRVPAPPVAAQQTTNHWLWISIFLASGWLLTIIYFVTRRIAKKPVIENKNEQNEVRYKETVSRLKQACADNDASAAKNALLAWGQQQFNSASLGAIADCCDARLRDEILQLNQVLYGKEAPQWTGKRLFQAFTENKARAKLAANEDKSLEPLYRL